MKKIVLVTVLILTTLLWVSCKKDEESQATNNKNSHRIKEEISNFQSDHYKTVYSYTNEKISQSLDYEQTLNGWETFGKSDFLYEDNKVTENMYQIDNGNWIPSYQSVRTFTAGKVTEIVYLKFNLNTWEPYFKQTFSYSGDKLMSQEYIDYTEGVWTPFSRVEFVYTNNRCDGYLGYRFSENAQWELFYKGELVYSNSRIEALILTIKEADQTWFNDQKSVYEYSNNKLISVKDYSWNSSLNAWETEVWSLDLYEYNSNGYLSRQAHTLYSAGIDYSFDYVYEEGNGNGEALLNSPSANLLGMPVIKKCRDVACNVSTTPES